MVRSAQGPCEKRALDLRFSAKNAKNQARPWGFTLIELLTVIAIIAVLATLLTATLSTAKRKSRQTVSISNLRQISLALNLYQDDHRKRPASYALLVREKYLTERSLLCPEDLVTRNWAGLIEDAAFFGSAGVPLAGDPSIDAVVPEIPHSYFKAFASSDDLWDRIEKSPLAGVAACQLHGIGRQSPDVPPTLLAYQGLVLRALKDMSVVSRQVFWQPVIDKTASLPSGPVSSFMPSNMPSDLPFFLDETQ